MIFLRPIALAIIALCMSTGIANGNILLTENFDYPDGSLVGNGTWINHSGTAGDLLVSGGQAVVQHGTPSEDAHAVFASVSSGILTANFDIVVTDDTAIESGDNEYFAHFMSDGNFNFRSRAYVVAANTMGNDYSLGLSTTSGGFTTQLSSDFTFGSTVNVTFDYNFASGQSSLTVGGETITGVAGVFESSLDSFALRQSDSSNNERITVDNVTVGAKIPEPTTTAILGLGLVAGLVRRRR